MRYIPNTTTYLDSTPNLSLSFHEPISNTDSYAPSPPEGLFMFGARCDRWKENANQFCPGWGSNPRPLSHGKPSTISACTARQYKRDFYIFFLFLLLKSDEDYVAKSASLMREFLWSQVLVNMVSPKNTILILKSLNLSNNPNLIILLVWLSLGFMTKVSVGRYMFIQWIMVRGKNVYLW